MGWLPLAAAIAIALAPGASSAKGKNPRTLHGTVNVNTATAEQLALLPGVGAAVAQRIVEARAEKPFERTWELTRVKGIGPKLFRKLQDRLKVSGETDLRWDEPPRATKRTRKLRRGPRIITFQQTAPAALFVGPPLPQTPASRRN
ncbi:competence protein [Vulgatibacter incomptus]|uniref:Competence protein n=1 Tax=Vulgatibacter incomptus TaxID=1391653 RepID=A0A0K1PFV5_9BACT|nr:competence protein [Vulgatibacter incomptus]